ncbi:hypothetical protein KGY64_01310 [Candidatus Bipolaricaulota bacterium]|nr:hypothetical protein [Candidatus Bipolaricaulota bacterium]
MTCSTPSNYFTERVIQVAIFDIVVTDEIMPTQSGLALLGLLLSKAKLTERPPSGHFDTNDLALHLGPFS